MEKIAESNLKYRFVKKCTGSLLALVLSSHAAFADFTSLVPDAPKLDAEAYVLIDEKSGKILTEYQADVKRDPASLTKMMTSYIVGKAIKLKQINLEDVVPINQTAWILGNPTLKGSSVMFLKPGDKVSVADLNRGIIIQSGNDACIAIAEYISGSQDAFVNIMNTYVTRLKLKNTHFQTVHGLDAPGQYTTAHDMALLGKAIIDDLPTEYTIYKEKEFTYNNIRQVNRNGLLWDTTINVDGIKTGHTNSAGYNLVASAVDGNTRLISAVLGGRTFKGREEESKKLLSWGLRFFKTVTPLTANKPIINERVWFGDKSRLALGSANDINLTVPKNQGNAIEMRYKIAKQYLKAPIARGEKVGNIQFVLNDKVIAKKPLVALEKIDTAGFFSRLWDYIRLALHKWFS